MFDRPRLQLPGQQFMFYTIAWELIDKPGFGRLKEDDDPRRALSVIRVTGVTSEGHSVCVDIQDPPLRVYIRNKHGCAFDLLRNAYIDQKLEESLTRERNRGTLLDGSRGEAQRQRLCTRAMADFDGQVVSHELVTRRFLQGVRAPFEFVEIRVIDGWARRNFYKIAVAAGLNTANERVEPCLDYRVHNKLTASCWVRVLGGREGPRTIVRAQIYALSRGLERVSELVMSVPPLLVASIDIECYSASGDFPKPEKPGDFISIIGVHLSRAHEQNGASSVVMFVAKPCAPVECTELRSHANERAMLSDFFEWMGAMHPEVILTYNGFGFDFAYIYTRAVGLYHLGITSMGAYKSTRKSELFTKDKKDGRGMAYFTIPGALNLDVLIPIGDDFKLASYKLDNVAEHFLGLSKIDLSPADIFQKTGPDASMEDVAEVVTYCVRDVELPLALMHALSLLLNKLAESETVNTTLNDLVTRGQGIKIFSYLAQLCYEQHDGMLIDDKPQHFNFLGGQKYEGAFVKEPLLADDNSVFHCNWPIVALDVGSLYPTIMRTFNLCFSSHQQDDSQVLEHPRTFEWEEHGHAERHTFDQHIHAVLPDAMRTLRVERQAVRTEQAVLDPDSIAWKVYQARQESIKRLMNSTYGSVGSATSMLAYVPVAKTITFLGREIIKQCAHYFESTYVYRVVYIDTDSTYVEIRNEELAGNYEALLKFAFDMGAKLEAEASQYIRTHFNMVDADAFVLEAEDVIRGLLLPSKKRYCCRLYKTPTEKGKLLVKGLSVKRRDSCKLFQDLLLRILERAIDVQDRKDAKLVIIEELEVIFTKMLNNDVPLELMATSKALRANYDNPTKPVHYYVAQKRIERGETVRAGERVPYVFVKVKNERAVKHQGMRAEAPDYVRDHPEVKVDFAFYIQSQLRGPAEQLLAPFWPGVVNFLKQWQSRLHGQQSITSFFASAPLPTADEYDEPILKRARMGAMAVTGAADGVPCDICDDSD